MSLSRYWPRLRKRLRTGAGRSFCRLCQGAVRTPFGVLTVHALSRTAARRQRQPYSDMCNNAFGDFISPTR